MKKYTNEDLYTNSIPSVEHATKKISLGSEVYYTDDDDADRIIKCINSHQYDNIGIIRGISGDGAPYPYYIELADGQKVPYSSIVVFDYEKEKESDDKEEDASSDQESEKDFSKQARMIGQWWSSIEIPTRIVRFNSQSFKDRVSDLIGKGYTIEEICDEDLVKNSIFPSSDSKYVIWDYFDYLDSSTPKGNPSGKEPEIASNTVSDKVETGINDAEQGIKSANDNRVDGLRMLEMAIANTIVSDIKTDIQNQFENFIKETYGTIPTKVVVIENEVKHELVGVFHEKFDKVLQIVRKKIPVYLEGQAGTGKNVMCKQIAESLGLEFYFSNAVTNEFTIKGFTNARGEYQESQFYKAFTRGGLFMLDEMDASIPDVLVMLNAAIANRYFDFPAPIGRVEANDNFRVVAAGNTSGTGASSLYTGRSVLDGASLDRFVHIYIDYDKRIEENVAEGDKELLEFARELRDAVRKIDFNLTVSYRGIKNCHDTESILGAKDAIYASFFKGTDESDVQMILNSMNIKPGNRFMNSLR